MDVSYRPPFYSLVKGVVQLPIWNICVIGQDREVVVEVTSDSRLVLVISALVSELKVVSAP